MVIVYIDIKQILQTWGLNLDIEIVLVVFGDSWTNSWLQFREGWFFFSEYMIDVEDSKKKAHSNLYQKKGLGFFRV